MRMELRPTSRGIGAPDLWRPSASCAASRAPLGVPHLPPCRPGGAARGLYELDKAHASL